MAGTSGSRMALSATSSAAADAATASSSDPVAAAVTCHYLTINTFSSIKYVLCSISSTTAANKTACTADTNLRKN